MEFEGGKSCFLNEMRKKWNFGFYLKRNVLRENKKEMADSIEN